MKISLSDVLLVLTASCAVIITSLLVKRELFPAVASNSAHPRATNVDNWRDFVAAGHSMGPRDAPVTILEFADFQCPYCLQLHQSLVELRQDTSISFRIVYRHFPLTDAHPLAVPSAEASECAGEQGKFAAYHDNLFENRQLLNASDWIGVAKLAGLADTAKFKKCVATHKYAAKVDADKEAGEKLGVAGTPTLVINGRQFSGAPSTSELRARILVAMH